MTGSVLLSDPAESLPAGLIGETFPSMGTAVTVILPEGTPGEAFELVRALFEIWNRRFTRFRPDSELMQVNAAAGSDTIVSATFIEVLLAALAAARDTDGLFDPTIHDRLVDLGYDRTFRELPSDRRGGPLRPWVGGRWREISVDPALRSVRLPAGVALDFGGIAKGMAVDAAIAELVTAGIRTLAVEAGGDLAVQGHPDGLDGWPIALDDPRDPLVVTLTGGALATSSVARRRWRRGGRWHHHLIDPRSGTSARTGLRAASIAAASCREAEVAAKVALMLGPDEAPAFLEGIDVGGVLVLADGSTRPVGRLGGAPGPASTGGA